MQGIVRIVCMCVWHCLCSWVPCSWFMSAMYDVCSTAMLEAPVRECAKPAHGDCASCHRRRCVLLELLLPAAMVPLVLELPLFMLPSLTRRPCHWSQLSTAASWWCCFPKLLHRCCCHRETQGASDASTSICFAMCFASTNAMNTCALNSCGVSRFLAFTAIEMWPRPPEGCFP